MISETKRILTCTEAEALVNLEDAATKLFKQSRWFPYRSKIRELQKPLLQLKIARRGSK